MSLRERAQFAARNILVNSMRASAVTASSNRSGVVVVHDDAPCRLSQVIIQGYRDFLEGTEEGRQFRGHFMPFSGADFLSTDPNAAASSVLNVAAENGTVVLVQNHAFQNQTRTYRLRLPLMERQLRVVEHPHLVFASTPVDIVGCESAESKSSSSSASVDLLLDQMCASYVESCAVSPDATDREARRIGAGIDAARTVKVVSRASDCAPLVYSGPMERCLYNTGKFWLDGAAIECGGSENSNPKSADLGCALRVPAGGFPFGEVISESVVLSDVSGEADIFAFPNTRRTMSCMRAVNNGSNGGGGGVPDSFRIKIEHGRIVDVDSKKAPREFVDLLNIVKEAEQQVLVRELGIGLNRALGRNNLLGDVTSFERQFGCHLSVGGRHPLFPKRPESRIREARETRKAWMSERGGAAVAELEALPELQKFDFMSRRGGKFHLDIFIDAARIEDGSTGATIVDFDA
jgi:hypothetical protein